MINYRRLTEADVPVVMSLLGQYPLQFPDFVKDRYPARWSDYLSSNQLDHVVYLVAVNETSEVIGHAGCLHNIEHDLPEIVGVVVSMNHRNQGVGRALIDQLCAHLQKKGLESVVLFTLGHPGNEGSIQFYKSIGFELSRTEADFFAKGYSRVTFTKNLESS